MDSIRREASDTWDTCDTYDTHQFFCSEGDRVMKHKIKGNHRVLCYR